MLPFQFPVSCPFLKATLQLLTSSSRLIVTSSLPTVFPSIKCFRTQFLLIMWPIQLAFPFVLYIRDSFPHWLYAILLSTHDRSNWWSHKIYIYQIQDSVEYSNNNNHTSQGRVPAILLLTTINIKEEWYPGVLQWHTFHTILTPRLFFSPIFFLQKEREWKTR